MKRIEYELRERGITQTALADKAGINRVTVNRILCGRETAWPKWRNALAAALDWPEERADELFMEVEVG